VEVWQTSNLRRLRLGEEKKKIEEEDRRNHRAKILWHRKSRNGVFSLKFCITWSQLNTLDLQNNQLYAPNRT